MVALTQKLNLMALRFHLGLFTVKKTVFVVMIYPFISRIRCTSFGVACGWLDLFPEFPDNPIRLSA